MKDGRAKGVHTLRIEMSCMSPDNTKPLTWLCWYEGAVEKCLLLELWQIKYHRVAWAFCV